MQAAGGTIWTEHSPSVTVGEEGQLATKTGGNLFRSVRASRPLPPNTHVYFEFHVSQLARRRSQDGKHTEDSVAAAGMQTDAAEAADTDTDADLETVISVGVALDKMPLNVPVGTCPSSIVSKSSMRMFS